MGTSMYWSMLALIVWTAVVGSLAAFKRINEIRARRIPLQLVATPRGVATTLNDTQAMDNLNNLLQMPLLFYVWCLSITQFSISSGYVLAMAWAYVALRIWHSIIQVTHNRVKQRFAVWVSSNVVLMLLWGVFAVQLAQLAH